MENRWREQEAEHLAPLGTLVYMTRLVGGEPRLVQWGAGNSSLKLTERDFRGEEVPVLRVKASGAAMASIDASGFAGVRLDLILPLRERDHVSDEEVEAYLERALMEPKGPRPSIETLLHAFIPHTAVLHSHAEPILALANAAESLRHIGDLFQGRVFAVAYRRSGFPLAKAVWEGFRRNPGAHGAILLHHGVITWGESCKEAYDRHIEIASLAEEYVESRKKPRTFVAAHPAGRAARRSAVARVLPHVRAKLFPSGRGVLCYDDSPEVLAFLDLPQAAELVREGPATPDHIVHTKRWPCFVTPPPSTEPPALREAIDRAIDEYASVYRRYAGSRLGTAEIPRDPYPRVLLIPGIGMVTAGRDGTEATAARDLYRQTLRVIEAAEALGGYRALGDDDAFELEFWPLVLRAHASRPSKGEFDGRIALVAGGAGKVGRATARQLLAEGAHVVIADADGCEVRAAEEELAKAFGGRCFGVVIDPADQRRLDAAFEEAVLRFGGLDILVLAGEFLGAAEALQAMEAQGAGIAVVFICSKSAAPAPASEGQSGAETAAARLARGLAARRGGIRVNAVSYCEETALPEDVAECVLFLASDRAAKTTGCTIPVGTDAPEACAQQA